MYEAWRRYLEMSNPGRQVNNRRLPPLPGATPVPSESPRTLPSGPHTPSGLAPLVAGRGSTSPLRGRSPASKPRHPVKPMHKEMVIRGRYSRYYIYLPCQQYNWSWMCVCVWVCENYVVYHLVGTGLHCAPLTCVCTTVHKGDLCPWEMGVAPDIFHFLMVHMEHAKNWHFLSVFGGAQE